MARVQIGSQEIVNNVSDLDAEVVIALLQRLAASINSIDADQINPKTIVESLIGDKAVSLRTLSPGLMGYDTLETDIDWVTAAYRPVNNTFTIIRSLPVGTNKLEVELTPPQDCFCLLDARMRYVYKVDLETERIYMDIYDTITGTPMVEFESDPMALPANTQKRLSIACSGVVMLNAGQTYRLVPRFKWLGVNQQESYKAQVTVLSNPKNTQMSAIMLPRL